MRTLLTALLLSAMIPCACIAQAAHAVTTSSASPLIPKAGETRFRATVFAVQPGGTITLAAESLTAAGAETLLFRTPRRLMLTTGSDCLIQKGDTPGNTSDIVPGVSVLVVGQSDAAGKNVTARYIRIGAKSTLMVSPLASRSKRPTVSFTNSTQTGIPALPSIATPGQTVVSGIEYDGVTRQKITIPMVFPILGRARWSDTFLASRGGGTRRHHGQDLVTPKMSKLIACFDGTVRMAKNGLGGNALYLQGANGYYAYYAHINNDTPGTNDGQGTAQYSFAPGLRNGQRVRAGQFLAYSGNSGNAETTVPHLHFELHKGKAVFNAAPSLTVATRLGAAKDALPDQMEPAYPTGPLDDFTSEQVMVAQSYPEDVPEQTSVEDSESVREPVAVAAATPAEPAPVVLNEDAKRILDVINFHRRDHGLAEVTLDDKLCRAAEAGSAIVLSKSEGNRLRATVPAERRVRDAGYNASGTILENTVVSSEEPDRIVALWMLRGGANRLQLLSPNVTTIGIGSTRATAGQTAWSVILTN